MDFPVKYTKNDVTIKLLKSCYNGYLKINKYQVCHKLFNGQQSKILDRELFERGHGVGILLYDPQLDQIVVVEQFRIGAVMAGFEPWQLEIAAGMIDKVNEDPMDVAYRETKEETGLELLNIQPIMRYLSSSGGSSETLQLYLGLVDATLAEGIHGLPDENEDIQVHVISREQAYQWVLEGKIPNAATIIALQWLQLHYQQMFGDQ